MTRKVGYMDIGIFRKVIDEVNTFPDEVRLKEIELFHFGESLLHPAMTEMNAYASGMGLNTVLSVNAPELKKDISKELIKDNPYKIIVSLDGFDEESFNLIRGRRIDYDQAVSNILGVHKLIGDFGSRTKLVVRMIAMASNAHTIDEFKAFWSRNGIEAEIREFFPWGEKEMEELGDFNKYPPYMVCPFSWQYVVVQWNGDVVACCRDYNAENVMGNVKNESLTEIWNGKAFESFRKNMVTGNYQNNICGPCMDLYYTEE